MYIYDSGSPPCVKRLFGNLPNARMFEACPDPAQFAFSEYAGFLFNTHPDFHTFAIIDLDISRSTVKRFELGFPPQVFFIFTVGLSSNCASCWAGELPCSQASCDSQEKGIRAHLILFKGVWLYVQVKMEWSASTDFQIFRALPPEINWPVPVPTSTKWVKYFRQTSAADCIHNPAPSKRSKSANDFGFLLCWQSEVFENCFLLYHCTQFWFSWFWVTIAAQYSFFDTIISGDWHLRFRLWDLC